MKHTICTDAGRITIEPHRQGGLHAVSVSVANIPGLPWPVLPSLLITPEHAELLAQAFTLAAEECTALAGRPEQLQQLPGGKGAAA